MLSKSIQIAIICGSIFCLDDAVALPSAAGNNLGAGGSPFQKLSFWGLPYPYGFTWQPCYEWRPVLTRHGRHRWYRVRVPDEDCTL